MAVCPKHKPRGFSTICLPASPDSYQQLIDSPTLFRQWLDQTFRDSPELLPKAFAQGYTLKDDRRSAKRRERAVDAERHRDDLDGAAGGMERCARCVLPA